MDLLDGSLGHGPPAVSPVAQMGLGLPMSGLLHRVPKGDLGIVGGIDPPAPERVLIELALVGNPAGLEGLLEGEPSAVDGDVAPSLDAP